MFSKDLKKKDIKFSEEIEIYRIRNDGINSDEDLVNFARKNNWGGKGIESNPYIIETEEGLPSQLYFLNVSQYVVMKNCNFEILEFVKSSNAKIIDCSLKRLNLIDVSQISIENTNISKLHMWKTKKNNFYNCEVKELGGGVNRKNLFQNCKLPDDAQEKLTKKVIDTSDLYLIAALAGLTFIFTYWQIEGMDYVFPGIMVWLWISYGFIMVFFLLSIGRKTYSKIKPNKII